ncbi:MAG: methyltransferase domain-containing protein [Verrucomicrobia bacterium]|nr:methyltransferase domain-containing protein [Verrucomicrobiota bacterium]MBS0637785.1 methyltransferase domain-containing protein [Verrucomicrobiota bacterium]
MDKHKEWVAQTFDRASQRYGENGCSFFDYFGSRLVDLACPKKGDAILDVATGKGAVLFPAAEKVTKSGSAVGIDISQQMVEEAKKRAPFPWITLQKMDAEKLIFADMSFDIVYCGFCLFFLPDVSRALHEFRRVLKPNGQLAVSVWGDRSPVDQWLAERIIALGITQRLSVQNLYSEQALKEALSKAGFTKIEIVTESKTFWHDSPEAWWETLWSHAIRAQLEQLSPSDLASLRQETFAYLGPGKVADSRNAIFALASV